MGRPKDIEPVEGQNQAGFSNEIGLNVSAARKITRRSFLRLGIISAAGAALTTCMPPTRPGQPPEATKLPDSTRVPTQPATSTAVSTATKAPVPTQSPSPEYIPNQVHPTATIPAFPITIEDKAFDPTLTDMSFAGLQKRLDQAIKDGKITPEGKQGILEKIDVQIANVVYLHYRQEVGLRLFTDAKNQTAEMKAYVKDKQYDLIYSWNGGTEDKYQTIITLTRTNEKGIKQIWWNGANSGALYLRPDAWKDNDVSKGYWIDLVNGEKPVIQWTNKLYQVGLPAGLSQVTTPVLWGVKDGNIQADDKFNVSVSNPEADHTGRWEVIGDPIKYVGGSEVSTWDPITLTWKKETLEGVKSVEKINGEWLAWPVEKEADRFRPIFKYNPTINKWEKFVPKITTIEIPDGKGGVGVAEILRLEPIDEKLIKRMVIKDKWDPKSKPFVVPFGFVKQLFHDIENDTNNINKVPITYKIRPISAIVRKIIPWPYLGYNPMHPGVLDTVLAALEIITRNGESQFILCNVVDQLSSVGDTLVNQTTGSTKSISGMEGIKYFKKESYIGQQIVLDISEHIHTDPNDTKPLYKAEVAYKKIIDVVETGNVFSTTMREHGFDLINIYPRYIPDI